MVIDCQGHVETANPAAQSLLGVVPRQPGRYNADAWQPPQPLWRPLAEALGGQRNYVPEGTDGVLRMHSKAGELAVLPRIRTIRDPYGDILGAAILLQDVTRLIAAPQEI